MLTVSLLTSDRHKNTLLMPDLFNSIFLTCSGDVDALLIKLETPLNKIKNKLKKIDIYRYRLKKKIH